MENEIRGLLEKAAKHAEKFGGNELSAQIAVQSAQVLATVQLANAIEKVGRKLDDLVLIQKDLTRGHTTLD